MSSFSCLLAFVLSISASPPFSKTAGVELAEAQRLIAAKDYGQALDLLRAGTLQSDIYPCDCDDSDHYHRSSQRQLAIVDCLLKLDREDEARKELRSLYEYSGETEYVIPGYAHILLIELETQNGYGEFIAWLKKHRPATPGYENQSIEYIATLKQKIESGTYDGAAGILGGIKPYHVFTAPRRIDWRIDALASYFKDNPEGMHYLIRQTETRRDGLLYDANRGAVYCLGEMGDPKAIPALRRAQAADQNYYTQLEILFALAKCGDREVVDELYRYRGGNLVHKQLVNRLLRDLTGKDFGEIHTEDDASTVFDKWARTLGIVAEKQSSPRS